MKSSNKIPIIDLKSCLPTPNNTPDKNVKVSKELYKALSEVGFAYLKNSGITSDEVNKVFNRMQEFFDQDIEVKRKFIYDDKGHGYMEFGLEKLNHDRPADLKETYNMIGEHANLSDKEWPNDIIPGFSADVIKFMNTCASLSRLICKLLAIGMNLKDKQYICDRHTKLNTADNATALRALRYPPLPDTFEIKPNQIRLGEHSDYGSFTLLFQDPIGGLQIQGLDGEFTDVVPIPDTVVLNIGNILQHWTSGRLKSTVHRVLIPEDEKLRKLQRRSMAYFVNPDGKVLIEPLEFEEDADPPRPDRVTEDIYPLKTAEEWLYSQFYKAVKY